MRDQHRGKRDLVNELNDVRKQVVDLKQAAIERRRVEEGLRHDREMLRMLLDQVSQPLCLLTAAGSPLLANGAFAELLGYGSAGEMVRVGKDLGLVLGEAAPTDGLAPAQPRNVTFRRSDGLARVLLAVTAAVPDTEYLAITILTDQQPA